MNREQAILMALSLTAEFGGKPPTDISEDQITAAAYVRGKNTVPGFPEEFYEQGSQKPGIRASARRHVEGRNAIMALLAAAERAIGPMPADMAEGSKMREQVRVYREEIKAEEAYLANKRLLAEVSEGQKPAEDSLDAFLKQVFGADTRVITVDCSPEGIDKLIKDFDAVAETDPQADKQATRDLIEVLDKTVMQLGRAIGPNSYALVGKQYCVMVTVHPEGVEYEVRKLMEGHEWPKANA
ncbi:MAG: hypothetical protein V4649_19415 [Bacteroidota bacterium]